MSTNFVYYFHCRNRCKKCLSVDLLHPDQVSYCRRSSPIADLGINPTALDEVGVHKASFRIESLHCMQSASAQSECLWPWLFPVRCEFRLDGILV
jgi:hypothetical protein